MRLVRLVWVGSVMHLKMASRSPFEIATGLVVPIVQATLAVYLLRALEEDMLLVLACSDPNAASVAPFGGTQAVFTPNPLALGFPLSEGGVMVEGVVDLAFKDKERDSTWVVVDYKTDFELSGRLEEYQHQLSLYSLGVSRATGQKVKAVLLRI